MVRWVKLLRTDSLRCRNKCQATRIRANEELNYLEVSKRTAVGQRRHAQPDGCTEVSTIALIHPWTPRLATSIWKGSMPVDDIAAEMYLTDSAVPAGWGESCNPLIHPVVIGSGRETPVLDGQVDT